MTSPFVLLPGLMMVLGLVPAGLSLVASFRRRRLLRGWVPVQATVTGNLHGADGPASKGMHRFAPSYEFQDARGQRWLGGRSSVSARHGSAAYASARSLRDRSAAGAIPDALEAVAR